MSFRDRPRAAALMDIDGALASPENVGNRRPASNILGLSISGASPSSYEQHLSSSSHQPSQHALARQSLDVTSEVLSQLSLSPIPRHRSPAPLNFHTASSLRDRDEVSLMLRARSLVSTIYASHYWPSMASPLDSEQILDISEDHINDALHCMGIVGIPALRENQAAAIVHALCGKNLFLALATGAGKSLCFQIPAIIQAHHDQKVTVVIQPTLEIISSQVKALSEYNIEVEVISSLSTSEEKDSLSERLYQEAYRPALIYTTAESFFGFYNSVFTTLLNNRALARIVLDEGHTILYWKEFRPLMGHLRTVTKSFENIPITIATASLTLGERKNLLNYFDIPLFPCHIISGSLDRPNLVYSVQPVHTFHRGPKLEAIYAFLKEKFGLRPESWRTQTWRSGLIYCATADHCRKVKAALNETFGLGYSQVLYGEKHSMTREEQRDAVQEWMNGRIPVLVATIAFGMGIDKSDVTFVIHYDMPRTIENYIQETGRAGRNGLQAHCLLLFSWQDVQRALFYAEQRAIARGDPTVFDTDATKAFALAQYASTLTTCRHLQLLTYFGTSSSTLEPCRHMCDNCIKAKGLHSLNVSATASNIVALFSSAPVLETRGANGFEKIINTLRGSSGQSVLPQKDELGDLFGCASKVDYKTVDAVFGMLLAHGVLRGIPDAKAGEPKWATNLKYSLGTRDLEIELYEDTDEHEQQQMILRTFVAAPTDISDGEHDRPEHSQHTSVHRRRRRRRRLATSSESEQDSEGEGEDPFTDERPALTRKAHGKLPQRVLNSPGSDRSSLSALTPVTPDRSQSSAASSLKRQRAPKISPRKRRRIDSDDEDSVIEIETRSSHSLNSRRNNARWIAMSPIEIFGSSDEDVERPMPGMSAQSKALPQRSQQEASRKTVANKVLNVVAADLVPEVDPPPRYTSAFEFLWGARRTVFERYARRNGATNERDVLSDRALLALAVHLPFDCPAFVAALKDCEADPRSKWPLYGVYFRGVLKSKAFEETLTARESSSAAQVPGKTHTSHRQISRQ